MENRMAVYGLVTVITSAVMLGANILFVAILKKGYISLIISACLANFIRMIMFRAAAGRKQKTSFDRELFRDMLKYALPLVPMVVVSWVLTLSDRYILLYYWDESVVGLYGVAQRFANVLNIVVSSVALAFTTFAFANVEEDDAKDKYRQVLNYVFIVLQAMVFVIATFARPVIDIMTKPAFHESYVLVQPLMYGQLLYCISTIIRYGFAYTRKSYLNLIPTGAAAVLNVVLNFILIPKYGAYAATMTTLVSYLLMTVLVEILSNKVYPCKYDIGKIFLIMAVGYVLSLVTRDMGLVFQAASFAVQAAVMYVVFRNEIKAVLRIASSVLKKRLGNR
jgi:O-antigen/teichoic acid export membrane protein